MILSGLTRWVSIGSRIPPYIDFWGLFWSPSGPKYILKFVKNTPRPSTQNVTSHVIINIPFQHMIYEREQNIIFYYGLKIPSLIIMYVCTCVFRIGHGVLRSGWNVEGMFSFRSLFWSLFYLQQYHYNVPLISRVWFFKVFNC